MGILCRDSSGRTCLRKQSKKKQRNIDICLIELYDFSFLLISNLCLLSPKMSTSLPTQDMNLPLTPALHRLDPEILFLEVGGQKEAGDVSEQPQTRQKRKIRVRTKIPLSSEVVRPDVDFLVNGKPTLAGRQNFIFGVITTTTSTTAAPNTTSALASPFSWLTNVFSFNGLPTNIFSPMALFGESLFSNVVSTADLGPHVLLK